MPVHASLRLYPLGAALETFMLFCCLVGWFGFYDGGGGLALALSGVHQHQKQSLSRVWCRGSCLKSQHLGS